MKEISKRSGFALIEVIVALIILAIASVSIANLLFQASSLLNRRWAAESETQIAAEVMTRISLLPTDKLDDAVGRSQRDNLIVEITHPSEELFDVVILDATDRALLSTTLYRKSKAIQSR